MNHSHTSSHIIRMWTLDTFPKISSNDQSPGKLAFKMVQEVWNVYHLEGIHHDHHVAEVKNVWLMRWAVWPTANVGGCENKRYKKRTTKTKKQSGVEALKAWHAFLQSAADAWRLAVLWIRRTKSLKKVTQGISGSWQLKNIHLKLFAASAIVFQRVWFDISRRNETTKCSVGKKKHCKIIHCKMVNVYSRFNH